MPRRRREVPWLDLHRGVYHAFWYDADQRQTRRLSLRTSDAREAQGRFAAFLIEGEAITRPNRPAGPTVGDAFDRYMAEHVVTVVDPVRIQDALDNLRPFFAALRPDEINGEKVRLYQAMRRDGRIGKLSRGGNPLPASNGTLARELGVLMAALRHEVREGRLSQGSLPTVRKPETPPSRGLWLFRDELDALRGVMQGRCRAFLDIAYYTASRKGAIERLTVFQVDLKAGLIDLSPPGDRATRKRRGVVPIDPALRPTLERCVAEAKAAGVPWVLGNSSLIDSSWRYWSTKAGLRELPARDTRPAGTCSPHILRHSRATHLLQDGVDVYAVAALLKDKVETVSRVYGHHDPRWVADSIGARR